MNLRNNIFGPLKVDRGDKVFIVSDLHINHDRDFIWESRGSYINNFKINGVKDYNNYIFNTLTELAVAHPDAYLISLGDNCFNDKDAEFAVRFANLPFQHIYTLLGNHTSGIKQYFGDKQTVGNCTILSSNINLAVDKNTNIVLSHYPLLDVATGVWGTLCGHCHGDMTCLNPGNSEFGRILDCGVDNALKTYGRIWFSLEEAIYLLSKKNSWHPMQLHKEGR